MTKKICLSLILIAVLVTACSEPFTPRPTSTVADQEQEISATFTPSTQQEEISATSTPSNEATEQNSKSDSAAVESAETESYPPPQPSQVIEYPAPEPEPKFEPEDVPYPAPQPTKRPAVVILNEPLNTSNSTVSGTGLPDLPIMIVNVSRNGQQLGRGTIGPDGTFEIEVSQLEEGTLVGVMADELAGSGYTAEDLHNCTGCRDLPLLGTILSQTVVP